MKLKQLESALCNVPNIEFNTPNITLEQYPTAAHLTAQIIQFATQQYQDIGPNRTVIDLGCGTAMLSIGCALVDTDHIIAIDCDTNALIQAKENVDAMELTDRISFLQAKVPLNSRRDPSNVHLNNQHHHNKNNNHHRHRNSGRMSGRTRSNQQYQRKVVSAGSSSIPVTKRIDAPMPESVKSDHHNNSNNNNGIEDIDDNEASETTSTNIDHDNKTSRFPLHDKCVDTVLTNPPFGTKGDNAGIDIAFVLLACQLARRAVYSFHKTTTRDYVLRTIKTKVSNIQSVAVIAEMKFDISNTYQFHQQKSVDIAVDLIRVEFMSV